MSEPTLSERLHRRARALAADGRALLAVVPALADPDRPLSDHSPRELERVRDWLLAQPRASQALRSALGAGGSTAAVTRRSTGG